MENIGFIGLGIMGRPMCMNLLKAGYEVTVYNRTKSKADAVIESGARWDNRDEKKISVKRTFF